MVRAQFLASLAAVASASDVEVSDVTIGGLKCDGIQEGHVVYPKDSSKKYPLLSFAHGWTEGAGNTKPNYKNIIEDVAAAGYVVVAEHSGATRLCYDDEKHDQLRAIDFVRETPEFADRVDWSSKVGVYGHSMGGAASGMNAADASAVSKYNLGAAVCLRDPIADKRLRELLREHFECDGAQCWRRRSGSPLPAATSSTASSLTASPPAGSGPPLTARPPAAPGGVSSTASPPARSAPSRPWMARMASSAWPRTPESRVPPSRARSGATEPRLPDSRRA